MIYYNENDPWKAAWLRELMAGGFISAGDVDERSIADVRPVDLDGYGQCHFFAGIGGWSYALRLAGWPDARPVWTGSCPCQPFSVAGARGGVNDERHLWPHWRWLIDQCRPVAVFGEQVASPDGRAWFAGVRADLDLLGYATGSADICAAGVGAPHIRQRLFWVADSVGDPDTARPQEWRVRFDGESATERWESEERPTGLSGVSGGWADSDIIAFAGGEARRIESGTFPLVDGIPGSVVPSSDPSASEAFATAEARRMRLAGYGDAIVPQVAAEFIGAFDAGLR